MVLGNIFLPLNKGTASKLASWQEFIFFHATTIHYFKGQTSKQASIAYLHAYFSYSNVSNLLGRPLCCSLYVLYQPAWHLEVVKDRYFKTILVFVSYLRWIHIHIKYFMDTFSLLDIPNYILSLLTFIFWIIILHRWKSPAIR